MKKVAFIGVVAAFTILTTLLMAERNNSRVLRQEIELAQPDPVATTLINTAPVNTTDVDADASATADQK